MKTIFFILIIGLLGIVNPSIHPNNLIGEWKLSVVVQNGDTLFNRSDTNASIRYSFKAHSHLDVLDSIEIVKKAISGFQNSARFSVIFKSDSSLLSSSVDRDTGFSSTTYDTSSFSLSNDTIIVYNKNQEKINAFFIDRENGLLYQDIGIKNYTIYNEFIKVK